MILTMLTFPYWGINNTPESVEKQKYQCFLPFLT
jgi:hypothetical protein